MQHMSLQLAWQHTSVRVPGVNQPSASVHLSDTGDSESWATMVLSFRSHNCKRRNNGFVLQVAQLQQERWMVAMFRWSCTTGASHTAAVSQYFFRVSCVPHSYHNTCLLPPGSPLFLLLASQKNCEDMQEKRTQVPSGTLWQTLIAQVRDMCLLGPHGPCNSHLCSVSIEGAGLHVP